MRPKSDQPTSSSKPQRAPPARAQWLFALWSLAASAGGCPNPAPVDAGPFSTPSDAGTADGGPAGPPSATLALNEADALSEPWRFTLPGPLDTIQLRAAPLDDERACLTFESLLVDGDEWIGPATSPADDALFCQRCDQRSLVQRPAFFVGPNNGTNWSGAGAGERVDVTLRVRARDCGSGLSLRGALGPPPAQVSVQAAGALAAPADDEVEVGVVWVNASALGFPAPFEESSLFAQARARIDALFAQVQLSVVDVDFIQMPSAARPVEFSTHDRAPLRALLQQARDSRALDDGALWVIFVPCLRQENETSLVTNAPAALTPQLPAGGGGADGVFVGVERCNDVAPGALYADGSVLGSLIAHEIGHALGLFHAVESGGQEDHLSDTTDDNLMNAAVPVFGLSPLTPMQATVIRHSPLVTPAP